MEKNVYAINFGTKSENEEFNNSILGKQWSWVREKAENWNMTKKTGSVNIIAKPGDIQATNNNAENILLQSANTDWVVESKLEFSKKPSGFSQSGGLVAYQDDDNYLKLVYGAGGGGRGFGRPGVTQSGSVLLVTEENGTPKNVATLSMADIIKDNISLYLKLEKKGDQYTASYSIDGKKFEPIGNTNIMLKDIKAGILVCEGVPDPRMARFMNRDGQSQQSAPQPPFEVSVDYFHITNSGVK